MVKQTAQAFYDIAKIGLLEVGCLRDSNYMHLQNMRAPFNGASPYITYEGKLLLVKEICRASEKTWLNCKALDPKQFTINCGCLRVKYGVTNITKTKTIKVEV